MGHDPGTPGATADSGRAPAASGTAHGSAVAWQGPVATRELVDTRMDQRQKLLERTGQNAHMPPSACRATADLTALADIMRVEHALHAEVVFDEPAFYPISGILRGLGEELGSRVLHWTRGPMALRTCLALVGGGMVQATEFQEPDFDDWGIHATEVIVYHSDEDSALRLGRWLLSVAEPFHYLPDDDDDEEPNPLEFEVREWRAARNGPTSTRRTLAARPFDEVRQSLPDATRTAWLQVSMRGLTHGGVHVWHGAPGTGKTTAIRALIKAWEWDVHAEVVMDPEQLLADTS